MNFPNVLTLSRIGFAVIMVVLLEQGSLWANVWAAIVFAIASLTDFYDGHLAKTRGLISDFGKIMDPVADKILLLSVFAVLAHLGLVVWWMFAVIAFREIIVTASRLWAMRRGRVLCAERAGKIKTVVQIVAVSAILLYLVAHSSPWFYHIQRVWSCVNYGLMLVAVILTVYSGIEYYFRVTTKP